MIITLNGEKKEFKDGSSVAAVLSEIGIDPRKIAVERNLGLVKRTEYDQTVLVDGDEIEIVNFVGGG